MQQPRQDLVFSMTLFHLPLSCKIHSQFLTPHFLRYPSTEFIYLDLYLPLCLCLVPSGKLIWLSLLISQLKYPSLYNLIWVFKFGSLYMDWFFNCCNYLLYIGYMFTVLKSNHHRCVARIPSDMEVVGYHWECLISGGCGGSYHWPGERHSLCGSGLLEVVLLF